MVEKEQLTRSTPGGTAENRLRVVGSRQDCKSRMLKVLPHRTVTSVAVSTTDVHIFAFDFSAGSEICSTQ